MLICAANAINLICAEWGATSKIILIAILSVVLLGVVVLLIAEIVGKRNLTASKPQEETEQPETAKEEEPTAEDNVSDEIEELGVEFGAQAEMSELDDEIAALDDSDDEEDESEAENIAMVDSTFLEEDEDADTGTMILGSARIQVRYIRSFTALLIQSDDALKGRYSELRNELMRYQLQPRKSWGNESWYTGRQTYAKFGIRGRTLSLYLALDPEQYEDSKYNFRDVSDTKKYDDVPMQIKIKSDRAVSWAKELIAEMASLLGLNRAEKAEENFRPDYEDTKTLVREKLIKIRYLTDGEISEEELENAAEADIRMLDRAPKDFSTKLMRADSDTKARYSEVKNELLRYGMSPRMSKTCESWYMGRQTYAKFMIRGKTLTLYMALDPKEFEGTKYNFVNVSNVGKFEVVPMRLNLRSNRAVKWVKELIATLAESKGWARQDLDEQDYRYVAEKKKKTRSAKERAKRKALIDSMEEAVDNETLTEQVAATDTAEE